MSDRADLFLMIPLTLIIVEGLGHLMVEQEEKQEEATLKCRQVLWPHSPVSRMAQAPYFLQGQELVPVS